MLAGSLDIAAGQNIYAAVAANISTRRAPVIKESVTENSAVKRETIASRVAISVTRYRTTIAPIGMRVEISVPRMFDMR